MSYIFNKVEDEVQKKANLKFFNLIVQQNQSYSEIEFDITQDMQNNKEESKEIYSLTYPNVVTITVE